jgi:arabinosyltransferase B/arabinosyltransferase C
LAIAHLLWWLPYGITLRPEPLIVLGSAAVLLLCKVARQRRSVGVLATATATAALTLTISPTALVAAAPLVINIPWVWQWLRTSSWGTRVGAILAVLAASSQLVPVGFADASIGDVLEGTKVHTYYLVHPWYQEFTHYETLLGGTRP